MADLTGTLEAIRHDDETRVVVIAASGPAFSAGHDLSEMVANRDAAGYRRLFDGCTLLMRAIRTIPQPVIAEVHGVATVAGCQLVAACDLAVAEEGARFGTPGVKIGLFCSTPMVPISRGSGEARARDAADRPAHQRRDRGRVGARESASSPSTDWATRSTISRCPSRTRARSRSRSASRPSTRRSTSTSDRPTTSRCP